MQAASGHAATKDVPHGCGRMACWRLRYIPLLAPDVYVGNIHRMIDFARIVGFDWDEGNRRESADKHAVGPSEAEGIFFNDPLLIVEDTRHSQAEPRYHALGKTNLGRPLYVTFTLRAEATRIRVISARDMHRQERVCYEREP